MGAASWERLESRYRYSGSMVYNTYRSQPFTSERQRVEFLFVLYEKLTSPLLAGIGKKKSPRKG